MIFKNRKIILRISQYKSTIIYYKQIGFTKIYSDFLGEKTGVTASQVRKDFSLFGIKGNKRGGYFIDDLLTALNKILGKEDTQKVIIAGAGNIGSALAGYKKFHSESIKIVACFDIDPVKTSKKGVVPVFPYSEMADFIRDNAIEVGIVAVPEVFAQDVVNNMVKAGIRGILNFAPVNIKEPSEDCYINNVNLEIELENIIYFVKKKE